MDDPILERIRELIEAARREAYERGQADAIRRIMAAASGASAASETASSVPGAARGSGAEAEPRRKRAPRGSVDARLVEILEAAPEGATVPEIESAAGADPEPLKTPSIRVALQRLLGSGRVRRDGRRWYLVPPDETADTLPETAADLAEEPSGTADEAQPEDGDQPEAGFTA